MGSRRRSDVVAPTAIELARSDIADVRAYERERDDFRRHVIAEKKRRRVHVGPFQTLVFENRDTVRFQIQEMARAERIMTDEGIDAELAIYNPLISRPGRLSATLFLELADTEALRRWLGRLVGIERSYQLHLGDGDVVIEGQVDDDHAATLSRDDVTATVHYLWFPVGADRVDALRSGPAFLVANHPEYQHRTELSGDTRASLAVELTP